MTAWIFIAGLVAVVFAADFIGRWRHNREWKRRAQQDRQR
jgi:hypothetical protein